MKHVIALSLAVLIGIGFSSAAAQKIVFARHTIGSIPQLDMTGCIYAERCTLPVKTVYINWDGDTLYTYSGTANPKGYKTTKAWALPKYPLLVPWYFVTWGDTLIVGYKLK